MHNAVEAGPEMQCDQFGMECAHRFFFNLGLIGINLSNSPNKYNYINNERRGVSMHPCIISVKYILCRDQTGAY